MLQHVVHLVLQSFQSEALQGKEDVDISPVPTQNKTAPPHCIITYQDISCNAARRPVGCSIDAAVMHLHNGRICVSQAGA